MPIKFYFDHQVPQAIVKGLRSRQVDVLTAREDGAHRLSDPELLDRATALGRVLFSQDKDLLREAESRQQRGSSFCGVIFSRQHKASIGKCIEDLELIAKAGNPQDLVDRVEFLPL
jgi:predicted nuclease of predicted toxin-antitoxin system